MAAMTRDQSILDIRPELSIQEGHGEIEAFQNKVLRPLLKLQNDLLLSITRDYLLRKHKQFNAYKVGVQQQLLQTAGKQDLEFKYMLINSIVGLLTLDELEHYHRYRSEMNKRIVQMAIERILSQLERLY